MQFGWINLIGALIVIIMMIPNLLYARKRTFENSVRIPKWVVILEQVGRYASLLLMVLPLGVWEFGFPSVFALLCYLLLNGILLAGYLLVWGSYFRKETRCRAMILAILPVGIFLINGICLHHWLLVCASILFAVGHITVTCRNHSDQI